MIINYEALGTNELTVDRPNAVYSIVILSNPSRHDMTFIIIIQYLITNSVATQFLQGNSVSLKQELKVKLMSVFRGSNYMNILQSSVVQSVSC